MKFIYAVLLIFALYTFPVHVVQASDVTVTGFTEVQINNAISQVSGSGGGTVTLPAGTYTISNPIYMKSNVCLHGAGDRRTVLKLVSHAGWDSFVPMISGTKLHDIRFTGIDFDGNDLNNYDVKSKTSNGKPWGNGFYNFVHLTDCSDIEMDHCTGHDSLGDGLRTKKCSNIKFHDNEFEKLGHDILFVIDSTNIEAYDNRLTTRINSALRVWNSNHVSFHDNYIDAQLDSTGGNPGIQLEDSTASMHDVEIFNNVIYQTWGAGIWSISYGSGSSSRQETIVYNNLFVGCGQSYNIPGVGGFVADGTKGDIIKNNVFDGNLNSAILVRSGGNGNIVSDNVFYGTEKHSAISQSGSGYAVATRAGGFTVDTNCFYANSVGNCYGLTATNSDTENPKTHPTTSGWTWENSGWKSSISGMPTTLKYTNHTTSDSNVTDHDTHEIKYVVLPNSTDMTAVLYQNGTSIKLSQLSTSIIKQDKKILVVRRYAISR